MEDNSNAVPSNVTRDIFSIPSVQYNNTDVDESWQECEADNCYLPLIYSDLRTISSSESEDEVTSLDCELLHCGEHEQNEDKNLDTLHSLLGDSEDNDPEKAASDLQFF